MKITKKELEVDARWFSPERDVARSNGIHLSHVLNYIEQRPSIDSELTQTGHRFASLGFLWERILEHLIHDNPRELWDWLFTAALNEVEDINVMRPGEQWLDAGECPPCGGTGCSACNDTGHVIVYMTPDGVHIDDGCLEEWKYTTKSSKDGVEHPKFDRWTKWQIPCYLKALGLNECRLRVFFARGDYSTGQPIPMEFMLTYEDHELDEIWDMVALNALAMIRNGIGVKP